MATATRKRKAKTSAKKASTGRKKASTGTKRAVRARAGSRPRTKRAPARSTASRAHARRAAPKRDPKGGLTAAGRRAFAREEGAHLRPGVKKVKTASDMRRKGSFLRRHYGRADPSPLETATGKPTRYALQAHAWGEPVPKTQADVRKLAQKGTRLLERYAAKKDA